MTAAIEAKSLSMTIGSARLLADVDLRIDDGEMIAIAGPNGAGKSTLMRLLSGDLRPGGGRIALRGRDLHAYPPRELASRRAMLSQHVHVTFPFTVEEIVRMGLGDHATAGAHDAVEQALREVGLGGMRHRQLPTLSGGEQQRAHFARVLVQLACGEAQQGPGVLLLDEPTSSLDLRHQIDLIDIARRRAAQGTAVIAILHDLNLAIRFADRIILMHRGRIAADGPSEAIVTDDNIRRIFDVDAAIGRTDDGTPFLLPQSMRQRHDVSAA